MRLKFILICLLFIIKVNGQGELPKILPPSPNAASLGEYGNVPVGLFTGTAQINIPIYTVKSKNLAVPISLNYSSNGVRVDQIASNVGLGWSLNAGGVITRNIVDDADEALFLDVPNNFPNAINQETINYLNNSIDSESTYDTASDNYSFNFNGFSGKFYLDENRNPILINPSPVKIEKTPNSTYAFKITDPSGTIYWFGNTNATETTMYQHIGSSQNGWSLENPTSWYLSRIEDSYNNFIEFTYSNYNKIYYSSLSQRVTAQAGIGISGVGQGLILTKSNTVIAELSSIISNNGHVDFTYSQNSTGFKQLDFIEIKDISDVLIKKFELNYDIITSSLLNIKNPHVTYQDEYGKRLFLSSVTEFNSLGQNNPSYLLTYYTPDQIPPRFSYAQDYWGYYNGVSNNNYLVSNGDYYLFYESNTQFLSNLFSNVGGDKSPNGNFGVNGLLKKITYPTKGFNELTYESHNYYGTELVYPSATQTFIALNNGEDEFLSTQTVTTNPITFEQTQTSLYLSTGKTCSQEGIPNATLTVKVAEEGSNVFVEDSSNGFYTVSVQGSIVQKGTNFTVYENSETEYFIDLHENKRYQFYMRVLRECVRGDFDISYYDEVPQEIQTNIEVGGLRIQKIVTDDSNGNQIEKKYHYGDLSCIDCSSGIVTPAIPAISYSKNIELTGGGTPIVKTTEILGLSSSTVNNIYNKQGHQIGYESVIEEYGTNFEGGGVLNKYDIASLTLEDPYLFPITGTAYSTNFGTGDLVEKTIFKKENGNFTTLQKIENIFYNNTILNQEQVFYNTRLRVSYSGLGCTTLECEIRDFDIHKYYLKSQWHYIKESIDTQYDINGLNPIITTKNYFYDNQDHLQVTKTETTSSQDNKTIITEIDYAHDLLGQEPLMQNLINTNRIAEPIQAKSSLNNTSNVLSKQLTKYHITSDGLLLPQIIQVTKDNQVLEDRIVYHKYNDKGNPLEVSKKDGQHITYIWGYNQSQPIAKIVNATFNDISAYISDLQTKSNNDDDRTVDIISGGNITYQGNEGILRAALNNVRAVLKEAMVTTYTYDPLIGITSITDPKGLVQYFYYDDFNRLQYVKDKHGNILSESEYHYKSQN